jgi:hypothetical protein
MRVWDILIMDGGIPVPKSSMRCRARSHSRQQRHEEGRKRRAAPNTTAVKALKPAWSY